MTFHGPPALASSEGRESPLTESQDASRAQAESVPTGHPRFGGFGAAAGLHGFAFCAAAFVLLAVLAAALAARTAAFLPLAAAFLCLAQDTIRPGHNSGAASA